MTKPKSRAKAMKACTHIVNGFLYDVIYRYGQRQRMAEYVRDTWKHCPICGKKVIRVSIKEIK